MSGDLSTYQGLERLTHMPDRSGNQGDRIAGQYYYDVELTGGAISNVTLTDVTINGVTTERTERVVTASGAVTVLSDDYVITIDKTVPAATTVNFPASPTTSRSIIIKDGQGEAGDNPITLDGNGKTFDGQSTFVIGADWGAVEVIYNGTEWNVLNAYVNDGDVIGPISSTDNAIARFEGTTGRVIQNSVVTIEDSGNISGVGTLEVSGQITSTVTTGTAPFVIDSTTRVNNLNVATAGLADTATALATPRTIGGVSFDGTANIVPQTIQIIDAAGDTTTFPMLGTSATGSLQPTTDTGLTYNATTKNLSTTTFTGAVTGNASTATALQTPRTIGNVSFDGTANIVPQTIEPASEASDTTCFPAFFNSDSATGQQPKYNSGFGYNSSTNALTATSFVGGLSGNATTATTLQTARSIYGNNFDGSADLTQIIASTYGGTGNGFSKFSGPSTAEKTFTLPNASATILTDNAAVTVAQGGTGLQTLTANNVILGNGTSNVQFVAPGTSGNVLTSNGTTWTSAAPPGASTLVLLGSATATASSVLSFTSMITSSYDHYMFVFEAINPGTTATNFQMSFSTDNGSTWLATGNAAWSCQKWQIGGSVAPAYTGTTNDNCILTGTGTTVSTSGYLSGWANLTLVTSSRADRNMFGRSFLGDVISGNQWDCNIGYNGNVTINAIRFLFSSGNIASGKIYLYGIKNT